MKGSDDNYRWFGFDRLATHHLLLLLSGDADVKATPADAARRRERMALPL